MNTYLKALVQTNAVSVEQDITVLEAIRSVRTLTPTDDGNTIYYVYITADRELVGVVSLRELLNAADDDPVATYMTTNIVTLSERTPLRDAINVFLDNQYPVLPVVDSAQQFVGIVRATDLIDALDEETTKQIFKQAGFWL